MGGPSSLLVVPLLRQVVMGGVRKQAEQASKQLSSLASAPLLTSRVLPGVPALTPPPNELEWG